MHVVTSNITLWRGIVTRRRLAALLPRAEPFALLARCSRPRLSAWFPFGCRFQFPRIACPPTALNARALPGARASVPVWPNFHSVSDSRDDQKRLS